MNGIAPPLMHPVATGLFVRFKEVECVLGVVEEAFNDDSAQNRWPCKTGQGSAFFACSRANARDFANTYFENHFGFRERSVKTMLEPETIVVLVSIVAAIFVSLCCHSLTCSERHACLKADTCVESTQSSSFGCAFRTRVTPSGWRLLNVSSSSRSVTAMQRGVCAPGLRLGTDPVNGKIDCFRQRFYPQALNTDIMSTTDVTPDHVKYCGAWIDAKTIVSGEERFAFFDEALVATDVDRSLTSKASNRLATTDMNKFRSSCRSMLASRSTALEEEVAYKFLLGKMGDIHSKADALRAVGVLSSFSCEGPVRLGLTTGAETFALFAQEGSLMSENAVNAILYAIGEDGTTRLYAERVAMMMQSYIVAIDTPSSIDESVILEIVHGALSFDYPSFDVNTRFDLQIVEANEPLLRFQRIFDDRPIAEITAYLKAVAATCAYAVSAVAGGTIGDLQLSGQSLHRPLAALGRLKSLPHDRFNVVNASHVRDASTATWSSLAFFATTHSNPKTQCLEAAKVVFPDEFDHQIFSTLVTPQLFAKLETMTSIIRYRVETTLESSLFAPTHTATGQALLRTNIRRTQLRIAGAPRRSWAGIGRTFVKPAFESTDGALLIMLKQARAVFLDRVERVIRRDSICQHPPLYAASERNAYLIVSGAYSCAMILPGILVAPFADERYDDASIYSRIGCVLAHEFAHVTAFDQYWNKQYMDELLDGYDPSTHVEAIADVVGIMSILHTGMADAETLCASVSQLWCARTSMLHPIESWLAHGEASHPAANVRGDRMCAFLRKHA